MNAVCRFVRHLPRAALLRLAVRQPWRFDADAAGAAGEVDGAAEAARQRAAHDATTGELATAVGARHGDDLVTLLNLLGDAELRAIATAERVTAAAAGEARPRPPATSAACARPCGPTAPASRPAATPR
ncbi:MAG: hypothetical protein H6708_20045 [Kofleriaceae bacterium]|nr:hypothetical protein [Kofleriaceae bacterium]